MALFRNLINTTFYREYGGRYNHDFHQLIKEVHGHKTKIGHRYLNSSLYSNPTYMRRKGIIHKDYDTLDIGRYYGGYAYWRDNPRRKFNKHRHIWDLCSVEKFMYNEEKRKWRDIEECCPYIEY